MGIDISRRQWDLVNQRISKLENKVRMLERKLEVFEKRIKPSELYRVVKQQEQEEAISSGIPKIPPNI